MLDRLIVLRHRVVRLTRQAIGIFICDVITTYWPLEANELEGV